MTSRCFIVTMQSYLAGKLFTPPELAHHHCALKLFEIKLEAYPKSLENVRIFCVTIRFFNRAQIFLAGYSEKVKSLIQIR